MAQAQQVSDVKPAFLVRKISGPFKREKIVYSKEEIGGKIVNKKEKKVEVIKEGYMVFHPRGHSLFVDSLERLRELKLDGDPQLVDMNSGDVVGNLGIPLSMAIDKQPDME